MAELRLLLANEPRSYREAIAQVVGAIWSSTEVAIIEPEELDDAVERLAPHLVICSRVTPAVQNHSFAWVELYTNHGPLSTVSIGGEVSTVDGMELSDLLSIVDRTAASLDRMTADSSGA